MDAHRAAANRASTYVAAASLILLLLYWLWRPIPEKVWDIENVNCRRVLWAVYFAGWALVFVSSFVIDHFELFGLKQVWRHYKAQEDVSAPFSAGCYTAGSATR